jgi:hypothetical protein
MSAMLIWLSLVIPAQAGDNAVPRVVESFVDENVAAVVRLDLARLDLRAVRAQIPKVLWEGVHRVTDARELDEATAVIALWVDAMKSAGVRELDLLIDASSLPGLPVVVVPLTEGADAGRIAKALKSNPPLAWPATATVRGAVIGGMPEAIARLTAAPLAARPEYAAARAEVADVPASVVLVPTDAMRRVIEETMPNLPPALGGGPITTVTRGLSWAALGAHLQPPASLTFTAQARDAKAAMELAGVLKQGLIALRKTVGARPETQDLVRQTRGLGFNVRDNQVISGVDVDELAALVGGPLRLVRAEARQAQCVNNLRQIALAMHIYHENKKTFPPAYIASKDGKPLLSWRVAILPYLDQQALYDEFHLDEPWNSPHNIKLLDRMPAVYRCPAGGLLPPLTTYFAPRGPRTMFPGAQGVGVRDVTDGTSNTILVIDGSVTRPADWTEPRDWEVGEAPNINTAMSEFHVDRCLAAFADGSVHAFPRKIAPEVFKALLTRDGGEVIKPGEF